MPLPGKTGIGWNHLIGGFGEFPIGSNAVQLVPVQAEVLQPLLTDAVVVVVLKMSYCWSSNWCAIDLVNRWRSTLINERGWQPLHLLLTSEYAGGGGGMLLIA